MAIQQQQGAQSTIFPTATLLATNAKIEAAKAAAEAKRAAYAQQSGAALKKEQAEEKPKAAVVTANPCGDLSELMSMGSGTSGRMVSKSCSAQLNQAKIMAAKEKAAKQAAAARELAKEEDRAKGPPDDMLFGLVKFDRS